MENYTSVPAQFVIGDTLIIEIPGGDYPAPGYSLRLVLISPATKLTVDSTAQGGNHLLTVDTSTLSAGRYDYQLQAIAAGFRRTLSRGATKALVDFSAAGLTTLDNRDWLEVAIDALEAAIAGRADKTQMAQKVGGTEVQHMSLAEQLDALERLKAKKMARSGKWKKTLKPRFVN